jgi:hypothetical protein
MSAARGDLGEDGDPGRGHGRVEREIPDGPSGTIAATPGGTGDALAILARELYWAAGPRASTTLDTGSVRERLNSFAHRMQVESRELYPATEPMLDPDGRLRRKAKRAIWHRIRFATFRYDRLIAELAELNAQLAERLATAERELDRLRADRPDPETDA